MIFHTYLPKHPLLKPFIKSFWYISQEYGDIVGVNPKMLPDGYYHMVINLGDDHFYIDKDGKKISPKLSHVNAKQTEFVTVERSGKVEIMGVIFQPYGLFALLQIPISDVSGAVWNMEDLLGIHIRVIEEKLLYASTIKEKCAELENGILQLMSHDVQVKPEIIFAGDLIMEKKGIISVKEILDQIQFSERSLERHFKVYMGVTPKQFADIQRMQFVLHRMRTSSDKLIHYAVQGEFYDQSHFIHAFKKMVGTTPQAYLQRRDLLSDLYNTESRKAVNL